MLFRMAMAFIIAVLTTNNLAWCGAPSADIVLADFEGNGFGDWKGEGDAFGKGPERGTLAGQQRVDGFLGKGLVNTYRNRDRATGHLTSPAFKIERNYLVFLIAGGQQSEFVYLELLIDGKRRYVATGRNSERLTWRHFDLRKLQGKTATIRIVDKGTGGWGHINVDQVMLSNASKGPRARVAMTSEELKQNAKEMAEKCGVKEIVFATREIGHDGHWYANFSYRSDNPDNLQYGNGGRLCRLNLATGELKVLVDDPKGGVRDPQMHYDGKKILFSYRKGGQSFYHLYEINIDGSGLRQITDGSFDDLEPCYLPNGDIVFCSSRCNRMVNCWFTRVAIIYRCDAKGQNIRPLSANIEQDNTPWVLPDGRLLHQRWEYIDRSQVRFHHLWVMNPDGTGQMVYYGNMHGGTVMIDAKPIPGSDKIVASFSPGHGKKEHAGVVTIVDPSSGPDDRTAAKPISRTLYRDPYPLSESAFIVARDRDFGILQKDGAYTPLWSIPGEWMTPALWVHEPRALRPRPRERVIPDRIDPDQSTGEVFVDDVYIGRNMEGVKRGDIKKLLVMEALPKPVNFSGGWEPLTYGGTFTLERLLGTVPVEADGSAHFEVPALRSVFFVALDENDMSVKRMQSFMTVQPGERVGCIGCHEDRVSTAKSAKMTLAMRRAPSEIAPIKNIPSVLDFPRDIQPILDRHCLDCHDYTEGEEGWTRAGDVILSGDRASIYSHSYFTLSSRFEFVIGLNSDGNRPPRSVGTSASPLMQRLDGQHYDAKLSPHEKDMIRYWIETGAPYPGTYAALGSGMSNGPSLEPIMQRRCAQCHTKKKRQLPPTARSLIVGGFGGGGVKQRNHPNYPRSSQLVYNLTRPRYSLILLAPLAKAAGGYELCRPLDAQGNAVTNNVTSKPVFASKNDPDYQAMLKAVEQSGEHLDKIKRFDMAGFRPNEHYIREMKIYGILPNDLPDDAPIDVYAADEKYWRSHWYIGKKQH